MRRSHAQWMGSWALWAMLAAALCAGAAQASDASVDARIPPGTGSFDYPFVSSGALRRITVWYHRPVDAGADAPIVFVLHGDGRDATNYRRRWIPEADARGFVLIVPEFSRSEFAGGRAYNLGGMRARDGSSYPESEWAYTAIENLFDAIREASGFTRTTYDLYGHSAGGQFVHRMVMFKPNARYRVAIAANPGWYTVPDLSIMFPYGLGGASEAADQLHRTLSRRLIVLLGDADTDPNHPQLLRSPEAVAQGPHRFARGHHFFEQAQRAAAARNVPFGWQLEVVPGAAHSNGQMTAHAARFVGHTQPAKD